MESYINQCRSLQTEKGSYVIKIEVPNGDIYSTVNKINTKTINNKFIDVIEYIQEAIFNANQELEVNENYIQDISGFLNYELFQSIKDLYSKPAVNNIEFQLSSVESFRSVLTERVQKRIPYFNRYLREVKTLLLEVVPLEAVGYIKRLASPAPLHSNKNEVVFDAEIANSVETIKIILNSDEYIEAIEAHKNEWPIRVKGQAKQGTTMLYLKSLEHFEVIRK